VCCVVGDARYLQAILYSMSIRLRTAKNHHSPAGELQRLQVACLPVMFSQSAPPHVGWHLSMLCPHLASLASTPSVSVRACVRF
jgi:hypothetical protein